MRSLVRVAGTGLACSALLLSFVALSALGFHQQDRQAGCACFRSYLFVTNCHRPNPHGPIRPWVCSARRLVTRRGHPRAVLRSGHAKPLGFRGLRPPGHMGTPEGRLGASCGPEGGSPHRVAGGNKTGAIYNTAPPLVRSGHCPVACHATGLIGRVLSKTPATPRRGI